MSEISYPTPISRREGCKVAWMTFTTREDAERAAQVARAHAAKLSDLGYDFGYQVPGSIEKVEAGYEVVIP